MQHGLVDWEDLDIFFDEFAVPAQLFLVDVATPIDLKGNFKTPYHKRDFGAFIVDADSPSFMCKWHSEFADVRKGDLLYVGEGDDLERFYIDSAPQNNGTGVVSFILTARSTQDAVGDDLDDDVGADDAPTGGLFGSNPGSN